MFGPRYLLVKDLDEFPAPEVTFASAEKNMLVPATGSPAPNFDLACAGGGRMSLDALRGRKVLLGFLRNAQCALCNLWVHEIAQHVPRWREQGLEVLGVFEATDAALVAQLGGRSPPFPLLADPDGSAHDAFGSRTDADRVNAVVASGEAHRWLTRAATRGFEPRAEPGTNFFRLPAEVLVAADGIVMRVHVAESVGDHLDLDVIEHFARRG